MNINKIKSFKENKEEFGKTKLKKLTNIIKIASAVSKGIMTFKQHEKFIKNGIKLYEEQMAENEKIKNVIIFVYFKNRIEIELYLYQQLVI